MAPQSLCFSVGAPLPGMRATRPALSPRTAVPHAKPTATVRMVAGGDAEKESLFDWFMKRFMHNFQDDGEAYGYEPYFKEIREAREAAQKEEYEKQEGKGR